MTVDKRTPHTDALDTLGHVIDDTAARDAIHLAVEPVYALERLLPGQHVGLVDGCATSKAAHKIGIVDPFIDGTVEQGQRFWLVVYPRTITSLRHVWTHPDFDEQQISAGSGVSKTEKEEAEEWLRDFIEVQHGLNYHKVLATALDMGRFPNDGYLIIYDQDASGDIPDKFWECVEIVTGQTIPQELWESYFSCAC